MVLTYSVSSLSLFTPDADSVNRSECSYQPLQIMLIWTNSEITSPCNRSLMCLIDGHTEPGILSDVKAVSKEGTNTLPADDSL